MTGGMPMPLVQRLQTRKGVLFPWESGKTDFAKLILPNLSKYLHFPIDISFIQFL
jgi:hypothetical protein